MGITLTTTVAATITAVAAKKVIESTFRTTLKVVNRTRSNILHAKCDKTDEWDFDGKGRPENGFKGGGIKSGGERSCRVELRNLVRKCPWTMHIDFEGGSKDVIKVNHHHVTHDGVNVSADCGKHTYTPLYEEIGDDSAMVTITIRDTDNHLNDIVTDIVDNAKKTGKYKGAIQKIDTELKSVAAKERPEYKRELEARKKELERNEEASNMFKKIDKYLGENKFDEAIATANEAEERATFSELLIKIREKRCDVILKQRDFEAQQLMKQADDLLKNKQYDQLFEVLASAERLTQSQEIMNKLAEKRRQMDECKNNDYAKELQTQGDKLKEQGDLEGALAKYNQGSYYAVDGKLRESIKENIEKTHNQQATVFKDKASALVNQGNTAEAIVQYYKALGSTNDTKLINDIKKEMTAIGDKVAEKLQNDSKNMIKQNDFVRGLDKLLDAKAYANGSALIQSIDNDIQAAYKQEATRIQNEANNLVKQGKYEEAIPVFDKALIMSRDPQTTQSILLNKKNTLKQHMELALESGQKLAAQNKFEEAQAKFSEAEALTTDESVLMSIIKDESKTLDKQNELLQKQVKKMIGQNQFNEAKIQLDKAMEYTTDPILLSSFVKCRADIATAHADFLQKEANKLAGQNKIKEANGLLTQALSIPYVDFKRTKSINEDRAKILNQEGLYLFESAFTVESSEKETKERDEKVKKILADAKELYLTAKMISPSKENRKNQTALNYKLEGNKYIEEAHKLEDKAFDLHDIAKQSEKFDDFNKAQNQFNASIVQYKKAEYSFKQGLKINKSFDKSLESASRAVNDLTELSDGINSSKVKSNIKEVKLQLAIENKIKLEKQEKEINANVKKEADADAKKTALTI